MHIYARDLEIVRDQRVRSELSDGTFDGGLAVSAALEDRRDELSGARSHRRVVQTENPAAGPQRPTPSSTVRALQRVINWPDAGHEAERRQLLVVDLLMKG